MQNLVLSALVVSVARLLVPGHGLSLEAAAHIWVGFVVWYTRGLTRRVAVACLAIATVTETLMFLGR